MNQQIKTVKILIFIIIIQIIDSRSAYAYLDLGTGSYLFQLAISFFVGAIYIIKVNLQKIKYFVKKHVLKTEDHEGNSN